MENNIKIIKITKSEVECLQKISIETFTETFGEYNKKEDLDNYLTEAYEINKLIKELENPNSFFYFIYYNNQLAGYTKFNINEAQSEKYNISNGFEIERIYIKKEYKRKGLGTKLMNIGFDLAKNYNKNFIWLGVWEFNYDAQKFYYKFGFERFSEHIFMVGVDKQTDWILSKNL